MVTRARDIADEMENLRMGRNRDLINRALIGIGRTPRTEEEMNELAREVARAPRVRNPRDELDELPSPPSGQEYSTSQSTSRTSKASFKKGGSTSSASKRADGIAQRGKTRGTIVACGGGYMKGKK